MILQRNADCPVWGWTEPGDTITVEFGGQSVKATTDKAGRWEAHLAPMKASSKGRSLIIKSQVGRHGEGGKPGVEIRNVLVGDIWLCSGQSNMSFGINGANQWWNELPGSPANGIRLFWVQPESAFKPAQTVRGSWSVASRESLLHLKRNYTSVGFSAIAWFYGRALHRETGVPIGLIECALGNTAIQSWSTIDSLRRLKKYKDVESSLKGFQQKHEQWATISDPGWKNEQTWLAPDYDDSDWPIAKNPRNWGETDLPGFNGLGWLRRSVELPENWLNHNLLLNLGALTERTTIWFNGHFLGGFDGGTHKDVISGKPIEQTYDVPAGIVINGKNVIVVRVHGRRGLYSRSENMVLALPGTENRISLLDQWRLRAGTPQKELVRRKRHPDRLNGVPGGLFNGMVSPLAPFTFRGAIWYQGEGNSGQKSYEQALRNMITDWRRVFSVGDFPFYIVQLAGYRPLAEKPKESSWAVTREIQARVAREMPNCGLAVAIDRGEISDIHPPNKRELGERLAALPLARLYGKAVACEGPTFKTSKVEQGRIRILFENAAGLKSVGGGPAGIAIAADNKHFVWAQARIEGETLVVWSPDVSEPVAVRYAWGDNTLCNLYNEADLPAVPFRTDDW
jgi:sialate O-acetylesterase